MPVVAGKRPAQCGANYKKLLAVFAWKRRGQRDGARGKLLAAYRLPSRKGPPCPGAPISDHSPQRRKTSHPRSIFRLHRQMVVPVGKQAMKVIFPPP